MTSRIDLRGADGRLLFGHAELACRATGIVQLAPGFAERLVALREVLGESMAVTSCCRAASHNRRIGGHPKSLHVYDEPAHGTGGTCALDVTLRDGVYALKLVGLAERMGWAVGINFQRRFIHLDRRADYRVGVPQLFSY
jgi:uncharacterized protein YcbK (DUF882 family)